MADRGRLSLAARVRWRLTPWWGRVLLVYVASRVVTGIILLVMAVVQAQLNSGVVPDPFSFATNWDGQWYWRIAASGYPSGLPVEIVVADVAEGARPGLDAPLAQAFVAAVGAVPRPKYGWTDVARFSALGIPAVNYGPGDPSLAHADDERVPLAQIERVETGLRRWLTAAD